MAIVLGILVVVLIVCVVVGCALLWLLDGPGGA